jgi:hypothetical protein
MPALLLFALLLLLLLPHCSDEEEAFAQAPEDAPDCTAWAAALKHGGYDSLSLQQRLEALLWLAGVVNEGPGVRGRLEAREREAAALRKQLLEDARVSGSDAYSCETAYSGVLRACL